MRCLLIKTWLLRVVGIVAFTAGGSRLNLPLVHAQEPAATAPAVAAKDVAAKDPAIKVDRHGDPLPVGAIARFGSIRFRHPNQVTMLAVSPDGKSVVTACAQETFLHRCDLSDGRLETFQPLGAAFNITHGYRRAQGMYFAAEGKHLIVVTNSRIECFDYSKLNTKAVAYPGESPSVWKLDLQQGIAACTALSSDGRKLAVAHNKGKLLIVDAANGKTLQTIETAVATPLDVTFSLDSSTISVSNHQQSEGLRSWNVGDGKIADTIKSLNMSAMTLAYSNDGRYLALGPMQPGVTIYDLKEKTAKPALTGYQNSFRWVEFSPDSKYLVGVDAIGNAVVFDPVNNKELRRIAVGGGQTVPSFHPDNRTLVTATGNVIDLWNLETGESVRPFEGHRAGVSHVTFSPNGQWLATGGQDNTTRLWDVQSSKQLYVNKRAQHGASMAAFTPDDKTLVWSNSAASIEFLNVRKMIAAGAKTNSDAATKPPKDKPDNAKAERDKSSSPVENELKTMHYGMFALSDDGKTLITNAANGSQLWDLTEKNPQAKIVPPASGTQGSVFAFSGDGRLSATFLNVSGNNRSFIITDMLRSREVARLVAPHDQQSVQGMFAAGGRLFLGRGNRNLVLWDVLSGKSVMNFNETNPGSYITAMTCSPDGRLLAWAEGDANKTIHLYDALAARELGRFTGHGGLVQSLRLHLQGDTPRLASASVDSTILLWDLTKVMDELSKNTPKLTEAQGDQVWADLGSDNAGRMHHAAWTLAAAGEAAVTLLGNRLEAVPADPLMGPKIKKLIEQMDDDRFAAREQASDDAAELGEAAEPFLREAVKNVSSAEVRHRVRRLLTELSSKPLVMPAEQQRAIRAIQIIEQVGAEQSNAGTTRAILERLAGGEPAARLTQEARASLTRIDERVK